MNHSTCPQSHLPRVPASIAAVGIIAVLAGLSSCSMQPENAETLASEADLDSAYGVRMADEDFDNTASRNHKAWGSVYMTQSELSDPNRNIVDYSAVADYESDPDLDTWKDKFGQVNAFATTDGAKLYHDSCAGCHMHKGEGAFSAGYYPPLANNTKMSSKYYIINILVNGFRGMPSFEQLLDDEQMAAVTQYVMTDLNGFDEVVTVEDAAQLRPDGGVNVEIR